MFNIESKIVVTTKTPTTTQNSTTTKTETTKSDTPTTTAEPKKASCGKSAVILTAMQSVLIIGSAVAFAVIKKR